MASPTIRFDRFVSILTLLAFLAGCAAGREEDVQDIAFWALGWQLKAVQNRVEPAYPPVLRYLRPGKPEVQSAEPSAALADELGRALFGGDVTQQRLERRLIGVFTVTGYCCAADGIPVRDRNVPVAGFVVLDIAKVEEEPPHWTTCDDLVLLDDRVVALRRLVVDALDRAGVPR